MNMRIPLFLLVFALIVQNVLAQNAHQNISASINVSGSTIKVDNKIDLPEGVLDA